MEVNFKYKNHNFKMEVHDDHIGKVINKNKTFYESGMLKAIEDLNLEGTYIDIGANIGNHTVFFGKLKNVEVKSFEASFSNFTKLKQNIEQNNIKAEIYNSILSDNNYSTYTVEKIEKNMGSCFCIKSDVSNSIRSKTLDIYNFKNVSLIKIDVEGMEFKVLLGALNTLKTYKPDLFVEIHDDDSNKENILKMLEQLNYKKLNRYNHSPTYHFTCKS